MSAMASQVTGVSIVYFTGCSGADQIKYQSVTGLCEGNSPATCEFPAQRASNAENVSIWWRPHKNDIILHHWCKMLLSGCKNCFSLIESNWAILKTKALKPPNVACHSYRRCHELSGTQSITNSVSALEIIRNDPVIKQSIFFRIPFQNTFTTYVVREVGISGFFCMLRVLLKFILCLITSLHSVLYCTGSCCGGNYFIIHKTSCYLNKIITYRPTAHACMSYIKAL